MDIVENLQHRGHAPVAQMDRAFASGAKGRRFESCQAYHLFKQLAGISETREYPLVPKTPTHFSS